MRQGKRLFDALMLVVMLSFATTTASAWEGMAMPKLHVEGRYFKDDAGNIVNLHGYAQTFSPWFNEMGTKWNNYDVAACLNYNKGIIDGINRAGWKMSFVRMHMDPYWSNVPGKSVSGENDISAFSFDRFKTYLGQVFIPMVQYAINHGMYVVLRPPGVCPETISVGDEYQKYLIKVWGFVSNHRLLRNNPNVMFELANEPVNIVKGSSQTGSFNEDEAITEYMQAIVDTIRAHSNNIILVPGLGYQSHYAGFVKHPVTGGNIGYAVHCYPGWYNGGHGDTDVVVNYEEFQRGWNQQITPIANRAPIVVTEMDWAPSKYNASWGKSNTGTAGGQGFGANFKKIVDSNGNISWLIFTSPEWLPKFKDEAGTEGNYTFLNDPEACVWPTYHWYEEYSTMTYPDIPVDTTEASGNYFPLTNVGFNPSIWEKGSFDETTGCLITGQYGFGGWEYQSSIDISEYKYLVVNLKQTQSVGASFRLFDKSSYWTEPYMIDFGSKTHIAIDLQNMKDKNGNKIDPSHIYIAGIWTYGGKPVYIKEVFLSNDGRTPAIPYDIPGDANNDGKVDVADITAIAAYILGKNPNPFVEKNADANCDGTIDVADITTVAGIILR